MSGQPADEKRGAGAGLEVRLHGGELGGLQPGDGLRAQVARDRLQQGRGDADRQGDGERAAVEGVLPVEEQEEGVDAGHGEPGSGVGGQCHVQGLLEGHRIQHARDGVDVGDPAVHQLEPGRRVHPGVGDDHEDAGRRAAHRHDDAGEQVRPG